jgi:hypothetical protein
VRACSGRSIACVPGASDTRPRVAASSTFVALLELADGSEHPRPAIPEFGRFLEQLKD